jgi:histone-lysine N-methyltransferase SETMAR
LFLQDNASPHEVAITHQKLADFHFEVLKHLAYSPDLAPSDYYLFPNLKGRKFFSTEEATLAANVVCSTTRRIFLEWVKEVITTKS